MKRKPAHNASPCKCCGIKCRHVPISKQTFGFTPAIHNCAYTSTNLLTRLLSPLWLSFTIFLLRN